MEGWSFWSLAKNLQSHQLRSPKMFTYLYIYILIHTYNYRFHKYRYYVYIYIFTFAHWANQGRILVQIRLAHGFEITNVNQVTTLFDACVVWNDWHLAQISLCILWFPRIQFVIRNWFYQVRYSATVWSWEKTQSSAPEMDDMATGIHLSEWPNKSMDMLKAWLVTSVLGKV